MTRFRYWLFQRMSEIAWRICPEPHRTNLHRGIGTWDEVYERMNRGPNT